MSFGASYSPVCFQVGACCSHPVISNFNVVVCSFVFKYFTRPLFYSSFCSCSCCYFTTDVCCKSSMFSFKLTHGGQLRACFSASPLNNHHNLVFSRLFTHRWAMTISFTSAGPSPLLHALVSLPTAVPLTSQVPKLLRTTVWLTALASHFFRIKNSVLQSLLSMLPYAQLDFDVLLLLLLYHRFIWVFHSTQLCIVLSVLTWVLLYHTASRFVSKRPLPDEGPV